MFHRLRQRIFVCGAFATQCAGLLDPGVPPFISDSIDVLQFCRDFAIAA